MTGVCPRPALLIPGRDRAERAGKGRKGRRFMITTGFAEQTAEEFVSQPLPACSLHALPALWSRRCPRLCVCLPGVNFGLGMHMQAPLPDGAHIRGIARNGRQTKPRTRMRPKRKKVQEPVSDAMNARPI